MVFQLLLWLHLRNNYTSKYLLNHYCVLGSDLNVLHTYVSYFLYKVEAILMFHRHLRSLTNWATQAPLKCWISSKVQNLKVSQKSIMILFPSNFFSFYCSWWTSCNFVQSQMTTPLFFLLGNQKYSKNPQLSYHDIEWYVKHKVSEFGPVGFGVA